MAVGGPGLARMKLRRTPPHSCTPEASTISSMIGTTGVGPPEEDAVPMLEAAGDRPLCVSSPE
jgi:hypothetical protein